jgi:phosphate uptake regulator
VVAMALEEIADCAENIANEVLTLKDQEIAGEIILNDIAKFSAQVTKIFDHSFKALLTGEINLANEALSTVKNIENDERRLTLKVLTYVKDVSVAVNLRIIVWNLSQIAKYCRMIGEVTINRIMEKPSEICKYVPLQEARPT